MRAVAIALVVLLIVTALPAGAVIDNMACTTAPARCVLKISRTIPGGQWWTQAFDTTTTPPTGSKTWIRAGTWFNVTADYTGSTNLVPTNRSGIIMWLEQHRATAPPRIVFGVTTWVEGSQAHAFVRSDIPMDVQVNRRATDTERWDQTFVGVRINSNFTISQSSTYRWVAIAPGADTVVNQIFIITSKNRLLSTTDTRQTWCQASGGGTGVCKTALLSYRDWKADVAVRTTGFEYLEDGGATFTVANRLYGFVGPATSGQTVVGPAVVGGFGTTWGHSTFSVTRPGGSSITRDMSYPVCTADTCTSPNGSICPGGPNESGTAPLVFNCSPFGTFSPVGTWTINIAEHEATGTTPDMIGILADVTPAV